jgi:Leucine-rich repeat (LRR) protein
MINKIVIFLFLSMVCFEGFAHAAACDLDLPVTQSATLVCPNTSVDISVDNSEIGNTYQLYDEEDNAVGSAVEGNGSTIVLPTGPMTTTSTLRVGVSGSCSFSYLTTTATIVVTAIDAIGGPPQVCSAEYATYTVPDGASNYTWTITGGNSVDGGDGFHYISIIWSNAIGTINVDIEGSGCIVSELTVHYEPISGYSETTQVVCSGSVASVSLQNFISGTSSPVSFEWNASAENSGVDGESLSVKNSSTISDNLTNLTSTDQYLTYNVTATSATATTCKSSFDVDVVVHPIPQGANTPISICSGGNPNVELQASISNGVTADSFEFIAVDNSNVTGEYTSGSSGYYITGIHTSTSAVPEEVIYVVTPRSGLGGFCPGNTFDVIVTVNPKPSIIGPAVVCAGVTDINYTTEAGHGPYSWSASGGSQQIDASTTDESFRIQWDTPGDFNIGLQEYTNSFGCTAVPYLTVHVDGGAPAGSNGTDASCSNVAANYDLQAQVGSPSSFSWIATPNPNVTGESVLALTTAFITDDLVNITNSDQMVSYTVTPTGICGTGSSFTVEVTVHPEPVAIAGNAVVCGKGVVGFDLTSRVTNEVSTSFQWSANSVPGVDGETSGDGVQSSNISDFLQTNSGTPETVVYTVNIESTTDFCPGTPFTVNVVVDLSPQNSYTEETVCSDQLISTSLVDGDHFTIAVTDNGLTQSGGGTPSAGTNKLPAELVDDRWTNTGVNAVDVVYDITAYSAHGCPSAPFTVAVHVNPEPILNTPAPSACTEANLAITLETDAASVTAATFDISSITPSGALTPAASNATIATGYLSDGISTDQWTNTSLVDETVTYVIVPVSDDGCAGDPANLIATIKPAPTVTATNNTPLISNGGVTNIMMTSNIAGSSFSYNSVSPVQIIGASSGTGPFIGQTLTNTGAVRQSVFYMITATSSGCTGAQQPVKVEVNGNPTISMADSAALVSLYNATSGANWGKQNNWLTGAADTWLGIGVTSERVTSISLPANNLTGELPTDVYTLSELINLILNDNALSGTLSTQVGNLTKLKILNLGGNDMTGTVPTEIYALTGLINFSLNHNQFTGALSPLIGSLVNLEVLRFNNLPMTGSIPAEVFTLTGLKTLGLSGKLDGPIPASIGEITGLKRLLCDNCGITSLPSQISTLTNLVAISVPNNKIPSLPDVSGLTLDSLIVTKNKLGFEAIEPNLDVPNFFFNPQDSIGTKIITTIQTGTPYSVTSAVGGSANEYQWRKNGSPLSGATSANYNIASTAFDDEGSYTVDVTSIAVPGLTLTSLATRLKVSSLKRDSLSLVQLYEKTKGGSWANKSGWLTGNLSTWTGVTINSNRVTAINLSNNNLDGKVPAAIGDMLSLSTVNFATNKLTQLPNLTPLTQLVTLNASANRLGFGSLEPNASILSKINYTNQADLGTVRQDSVETGSLVKMKAITDGLNNVYQWKKNGAALAGAADSTYTIQSIGRTNMGQYVCEITNPNVPGLTLKSAAHTVLASTDLSGKLFIEANVPATKGQITLFRVTNSNGYDTIKVIQVKNDGTFQFKKVVLDNYQILGYADIETYDRALPTYYKKTILWEEADILSVDAPLVDLNIVSELKPGPPSGKGIISGFVEEDDGTGNGRTKKPQRVSSAGVSARRVENTGRGKEEILTLVAYVFTNENGEFEITNLALGEYRLNIQYPGYPMDEKSFVTVPIGNALEAEVRVEAFVEAGKITVRQLIITGIMSTEGYKADVYPNPSNDFIEVTFGSVSAYREVGMFDTMGKKISNASASDTHVSLDIRSLPKGNYLLNVTEKGHPVKSLHVIIE